MARIRSLKPELLEDDKTAALDHLQWRIFVSLILLADDYGNFRANPVRVAGATLWARPLADLVPVLAELNNAGLIRLYFVGGQPYGHITGWSKHQKVDHPGPPKCPKPEQADQTPEEFANASRAILESLAPDLIGSDRIGSEGIGEEEIAPRREDPSSPPPEPDPPVPGLDFPVDGTGPASTRAPTWSATRGVIRSLSEAFPSLDVEGECRKAKAWVEANPAKRKTASGMRRFLVNWLSRAQNSGRGTAQARGSPAPPDPYANLPRMTANGAKKP